MWKIRVVRFEKLNEEFETLNRQLGIVNVEVEILWAHVGFATTCSIFFPGTKTRPFRRAERTDLNQRRG